MRSSSNSPLLREIRSVAALTLALALLISLLVTGLSAYQVFLDGKARMSASLATFNRLFLDEYFKQIRQSLDMMTVSFNREAAMAGKPVVTPVWKMVSRILPGHISTFFYNARTGHFEIQPEYFLTGTFHPEERPWYPLTLAPMRGETWIAPYEDLFLYVDVITIARQIYAPTGEFLGVLAMDMSSDILEQKLRLALDNDKTNLYIFSENSLIFSILNDGVDIHANTLSDFRAAQANRSVLEKMFDTAVEWESADPPLTFVLTASRMSLLKDTLYYVPFYLFPILMGFFLFYIFMMRLARRLILEQKGLSSALRNLGKDPESLLHAKHSFFLPMDELSQVAMQIESQDEKINEDPLTKVYSRRKFENDYTTMLNGDDDFYLLMLDVDNFKNVNDSFGHLVGDNVLRRIASTMRQVGDAQMRAYRFGGDEFCAILEPGIDVAELCATLCEKVNNMQWREEGLTVSVSIGVARYKEIKTRDDPGGALMALADSRLYTSKARGKNGFSFSDEA